MRRIVSLCIVALFCLAASGGAMAQNITAKLGNTSGATFQVQDSSANSIITATANATSPNIVMGYHGNSILTGAYGSVIGGGGNSGDVNTIYDHYCVIAGGANNTAGSNDGSTSLQIYATVGGGVSNTASGQGSTVAGGAQSTASAMAATVGGGLSNHATAQYATVPGGSGNTASGQYSFAAGTGATASHDNSFVWGDEYGFGVSGANNEVRFYYGGAGRFCTVSGAAVGWACTSDRAFKENFEELDKKAVLKALVAMPVMKYTMKDGGPSIHHVGPVAQDFHAAFSLGANDKTIGSSDAVGVTMAAVQGLYRVVEEKDARISELEAEIRTLKTRTAAFEHQAAKMLLLEAAVRKLSDRSGLSMDAMAVSTSR